jgi:hypothetical protein
MGGDVVGSFVEHGATAWRSKETARNANQTGSIWMLCPFEWFLLLNEWEQCG